MNTYRLCGLRKEISHRLSLALIGDHLIDAAPASFAYRSRKLIILMNVMHTGILIIPQEELISSIT
mgnify:CR=1 FL=1